MLESLGVCGVSRLARVIMDAGVQSDVECVFNVGWPGFELLGALAVGASSGRSLSSSSTSLSVKKNNSLKV